MTPTTNHDLPEGLLAIVEAQGGVLSPRQLMRASRGRYPSARDATRALGQLVRARLGIWVNLGTTPKGGRPTRLFSLRACDKTPANGQGIRGVVSRGDRVVKPLKVHGGKHDLATWIVSLMPWHRRYVEVFGGGLSVLWAHPPVGAAEVVNDLDGRISNFFRVLQDEATFARFVRQVDCVQFSRDEWDGAHAHVYGADPVADAVAFFIDSRQSLGARRDRFAPPVRNRNRGGGDEHTKAWRSAVEGLAEVHDRLKRVRIENLHFLELIDREDTKDTLFYCDPTYLHETRADPGTYGPFEMTAAQHRAMLRRLRRCQGMVMLSGYPSELYDRMLHDWARHTFDVANHAAGGKVKGRETECLWCNPACF
jgi:DNA adenine methylase